MAVDEAYGREELAALYDMLNPDSGENNLGASLHDIWLTMFSPTLLLIATPLLIRWAAKRPSADSLEQPLE